MYHTNGKHRLDSTNSHLAKFTPFITGGRLGVGVVVMRMGGGGQVAEFEMPAASSTFVPKRATGREP